MKPEDVKLRLEDIRSASGDPECAHGLEDRLRADVLKAIMRGKVKRKDIEAVCRLALATDNIEFPRWCA